MRESVVNTYEVAHFVSASLGVDDLLSSLDSIRHSGRLK